MLEHAPSIRSYGQSGDRIMQCALTGIGRLMHWSSDRSPQSRGGGVRHRRASQLFVSPVAHHQSVLFGQSPSTVEQEATLPGRTRLVSTERLTH